MERLRIDDEIMPTAGYKKERRNAMLVIVSSAERQLNEKLKIKEKSSTNFLLKVSNNTQLSVLPDLIRNYAIVTSSRHCPNSN